MLSLRFYIEVCLQKIFWGDEQKLMRHKIMVEFRCSVHFMVPQDSVSAILGNHERHVSFPTLNSSSIKGSHCPHVAFGDMACWKFDCVNFNCSSSELESRLFECVVMNSSALARLLKFQTVSVKSSSADVPSMGQ